jgi:hypothetical protein
MARSQFFEEKKKPANPKNTAVQVDSAENCTAQLQNENEVQSA